MLNSPTNLWIKDGRMENVTGPAVIISNEKYSARTEINMENVVCRGVPVFVSYRESAEKELVAGPSEIYQVKTFLTAFIMRISQRCAPVSPRRIRLRRHRRLCRNQPSPDIFDLAPNGDVINIRDLRCGRRWQGGGYRGVQKSHRGASRDLRAVRPVPSHRYDHAKAGYDSDRTSSERDTHSARGSLPRLSGRWQSQAACLKPPAAERILLPASDCTQTESIRERWPTKWMAGSDSLDDERRSIPGWLRHG